MKETHPLLKCTFKKDQPHLCTTHITIPSQFVDNIYEEACIAQKDKIHTHGFSKGTTPLSYIQQNYKSNLIDHIKEFLFKYFVISFLYKELRDKKILFVDEPRLSDIYAEPGHNSEFIFELFLIDQIEIKKWKDFPFKAPKRKNYKDIDRQVDTFIKQEQKQMKEYHDDSIHISDWVCFDIYPINKKENPLLGIYKENLWLKIGDEEADTPFQKIFLQKKIGDHFSSTSFCFQRYFSEQINTQYNFCIEIKDVLPHAFCSLDWFKQHFKLKTIKELNKKLIEVFSYRNDLSQRRSMVEETFKLLLSKHQFDIPNYLILRQQKKVLESVQNNPDYQVYKTQQNFNENVRLLATKQIKEMIMIDQLSYKENIPVSHQDVKNYLNMLKRPRTKEFIYFMPPESKLNGQEIPLPTQLLKRCCLREKTLNHIIYYLTRK